MIRFEDARRIIEEFPYTPAVEMTALSGALYRVLAEDIRADMDMPPFDKSAMDGFACRRNDLPGPLRVTGTIAAGRETGIHIGAGECARIMTGAKVPPGADCVIMLEDTESDPDGRTVRFTATQDPGRTSAWRERTSVRATSFSNGALFWNLAICRFWPAWDTPGRRYMPGRLWVSS